MTVCGGGDHDRKSGASDTVWGAFRRKAPVVEHAERLRRGSPSGGKMRKRLKTEVKTEKNISRFGKPYGSRR